MDEFYFIHQCTALIEEKLNRGKSQSWSQADFKALSSAVYAASQVLISVQTLKRIVGRVKTYRNYTPQLDTRNALARYLGYRNWDNFVTAYPGGLPAKPVPVEPSPEPIPQTPFTRANTPASVDRTVPVTAKMPVKKAAGQWAYPLIAFGAVAGILVLYLSFVRKPAKSPAVYIQTKDTVGLAPMNVQLQYAITGLASGSVAVDFGNHNLEPLDQEKHFLSNTYLLPNLYRMRVLVNGQPQQTKNIHVQSNGWDGIIFAREPGNTSNRIFIRNHENIFRLGDMHLLPPGVLRKSPGLLYVAPRELEQRKLPRKTSWISFRQVKDFDLSGDALVLETRIRNSTKLEGAWCNDAIIQVLGETGTISLHFVSPGCQSEVLLQCSEVEIEGTFHDLSAFAGDFADWKPLRLEVNNKTAGIVLDNRPVYRIPYQRAIGRVKGIIYTFKGCGAVDYVRLYDKQRNLVYGEDFDD